MTIVNWIIVVVVLGSSTWAAIDAKRNRIPTFGDKYEFNTGALAWFLGCLILWIIVFPVYLFKRQKVLRSRR